MSSTMTAAQATERIGARYPQFREGLPGQYDVIRHHGFEVLSPLGVDEIAPLAFQFLGLFLLLLPLVLTWHRWLGWSAVARKTESASPRQQRLAQDFVNKRWTRVAATVLMCSFGLALCSGLIASWVSGRAG